MQFNTIQCNTAVPNTQMDPVLDSPKGDVAALFQLFSPRHWRFASGRTPRSSLEGPCSAKKSFTGCLKSFKSFPQMTSDHFSPQSRTPCRIPCFQSGDNGVTASIESGQFFSASQRQKNSARH